MQGNVLRECGTSLRAIIANSSMPTGAVESYVADLLLDSSVLDISRVCGKNNTLIKHIRHMWSTRLKCDMFKIIYFKLFVYWVWGVLQLIQGSTFCLECLYFTLCLKQIAAKLMFEVRNMLKFKWVWNLCFWLQRSYPDPFNTNDMSAD